MHLEEKYLKMVKEILKKNTPELEVWAFGSRVTGGNRLKKFSDLDLALKTKNGEKIDSNIMSQLRDEFDESELPIKIDILDLNSVSEEFAKIIKENYKIIQ